LKAKELNDAFQSSFDRPVQQRFLISQQNQAESVQATEGTFVL
jgi:hypothetical protein